MAREDRTVFDARLADLEDQIEALGRRLAGLQRQLDELRIGRD